MWRSTFKIGAAQLRLVTEITAEITAPCVSTVALLICSNKRRICDKKKKKNKNET